jgi:hypothetical protein
LSGAADTGRDLPDRLLTDLALGTFPIKRLPRVIRRALVSHPRKCLIRRHPDARPSDAAMREAEQRQQRVPRAACDLASIGAVPLGLVVPVTGIICLCARAIVFQSDR